MGTVTVDSKPGSDVLIDGAWWGQTPVVGVKLPVGRHQITLINAANSIKETVRVEIKPGQPEKVVRDYRERIPEAKKTGANATINPFTKRGSAAR